MYTGLVLLMSLMNFGSSAGSSLKNSAPIEPMDGSVWLQEDGVRAVWLSHEAVDERMLDYTVRMHFCKDKTLVKVVYVMRHSVWDRQRGTVSIKDLQAGMAKRSDAASREEWRERGTAGQQTVSRGALVETIRQTLS